MPQHEFRVRPMEDFDLNAWFELRKKLWDVTVEEDHKAEMLEILDNPDNELVLVAESPEGNLLGFLEASIRPFVEDCETENVGYLEGWFVDPAYRRRGIGAQLVRTAEAWARRRGCLEMASDAEIGNDVSLAAHLSLGYAETSRLVHLRKELE